MKTQARILILLEPFWVHTSHYKLNIMVVLKNAIFKLLHSWHEKNCSERNTLCLSGHFRAAILCLANYLLKSKAEQYIGSGISQVLAFKLQSCTPDTCSVPSDFKIFVLHSWHGSIFFQNITLLVTWTYLDKFKAKTSKLSNK